MGVRGFATGHNIHIRPVCTVCNVCTVCKLCVMEVEELTCCSSCTVALFGVGRGGGAHRALYRLQGEEDMKLPVHLA